MPRPNPRMTAPSAEDPESIEEADSSADPADGLNGAGRPEGVEGTGLTEIERQVIDLFVRLARVLGQPKSIGEIYGLLFITSRALSMSEIIDRLQLSKGSASQGLRLLRTLGAVRVQYQPGDRRDFFEPETRLRRVVQGYLKEEVLPHVQSGEERLRVIETMAKDATVLSAADLAFYEERISKLRQWHRRGSQLLPLAQKVLTI